MVVQQMLGHIHKKPVGINSMESFLSFIHSGVEQWLARKAHNLEVAGSNPARRNQKNILTNDYLFDIIQLIIDIESS